jgi:hypothetical protein
MVEYKEERVGRKEEWGGKEGRSVKGEKGGGVEEDGEGITNKGKDTKKERLLFVHVIFVPLMTETFSFQENGLVWWSESEIF